METPDTARPPSATRERAPIPCSAVGALSHPRNLNAQRYVSARNLDAADGASDAERHAPRHAVDACDDSHRH